MFQTLTWTKILSGAAIDDNSKIYVLGNNQARTFTFTAAGGGSYRLSGTPMPDPMRVQSFSATVRDSASRPYRGIRLVLGMLTGKTDDPLVFLHSGVTGDKGNMWVRVPFQFRSEWGLVVQMPFYLPSATYHIKAVVNYECS